MAGSAPLLPNLVAIEGIDKSGKTTLTTAIRDHLRAQSLTVACHREPSDSLLGSSFRQVSVLPSTDPIALALLSCADRRDQSSALHDLCDTHGLVLADRYYLSGLAYHAADGVPAAYYAALNKGIARPGLYLYLDVAPEVAALRYRDTDRPDRWEHADLASRLPDTYAAALDHVTRIDQVPVVRLDASASPQAVLTSALAALDPLLPLKEPT